MSPAAAAAPPPSAVTSVTIVSKSTVYPDRKSSMDDLRLSVSDLPMLSCHYIQKGLLFPPPSIPIRPLLSLLTRSLSRALSVFPPLAGCLITRPQDGSIYISCNDAGVDFVHATSDPALTLPLLLPESPSGDGDNDDDVPRVFNSLFALDGALSYHGHFLPLAAFQLTEFGDGGVFIGCTVNHAIVDGTSFWNFFNTWAELCRAEAAPMSLTPTPSRVPDFRRNFFGDSKAVLRFPSGAGPQITFDADAPLRVRIFHFSREAILELKSRANRPFDPVCMAEACGKQVHDRQWKDQTKTTTAEEKEEEDMMISSFKSLCAQLWISVTRARKHLAAEATTTFRMAMNCRHRVVPKVDPYYFGNALQSVPTTAAVVEVASGELRWVAGLLHRSVAAYGVERVRQAVEEWEAAPRCFPLGNPDGAGVTMGSSPRFPMYEGNDFGWGRPLAVRSGRANKFDGKISAFPGRDGDGSVELEVCLAFDTMAALITDRDFMQYVSNPVVVPPIHCSSASAIASQPAN